MGRNKGAAVSADPLPSQATGEDAPESVSDVTASQGWLLYMM
jgi:hypothetical protein